jgi:hypothetical protein
VQVFLHGVYRRRSGASECHHRAAISTVRSPFFAHHA